MTSFDDTIWRLAVADFAFRQQVAAGLVPPAEQKAHEAWLAEQIEQLDEARGTADVKYEQFRTAFEQGADCAALYELRNRMHPKDPLKEAANEDLRSVDCYSPRSIRADRDV